MAAVENDFTIVFELETTAEDLYQAWLDGSRHSAFTGGEADIDKNIGGIYTAWDAYIQGVNLSLEYPKRILQSWRTTEFPEGSPDSMLELTMENIDGGVRVELTHTHIPEGQHQQYYDGWHEHYIEPMKRYFSVS